MVIIRIVVLVCLLFIGPLIKSANASDSFDRTSSDYFQIGYGYIYEELQISSEHFEKKIVLPNRLPPITFTHSFGRFSDLDGNINDQFEVVYVNEDKPKHTYSLSIRPVRNGIKFENKHITQIVKLRDGSNAIFSKRVRGFNLMVVEKFGFQYILSIPDEVNIDTKEVLAEIANSIADH
ncbi:hypothetical protein GJU41_19080 [Bacillus idriensis]|uniref:DUF4367 domain-containing protein n=1 Tax=Metabacillus idriensis TaxID=324768 RepID=A0A6I2MCD4_9BACI|nr:hypothetical protein [Metabacillus idriensis]